MKFMLADKREIDKTLFELFKILYSNMSIIALTNNSYDDDFKCWISSIIPDMKKENHKTL